MSSQGAALTRSARGPSSELPAWKVGDHGFEPRSGIQVSKKQNCFFPAQGWVRVTRSLAHS